METEIWEPQFLVLNERNSVQNGTKESYRLFNSRKIPLINSCCKDSESTKYDVFLKHQALLNLKAMLSNEQQLSKQRKHSPEMDLLINNQTNQRLRENAELQKWSPIDVKTYQKPIVINETYPELAKHILQLLNSNNSMDIMYGIDFRSSKNTVPLTHTFENPYEILVPTVMESLMNKIIAGYSLSQFELEGLASLLNIIGRLNSNELEIYFKLLKIRGILPRNIIKRMQKTLRKSEPSGHRSVMKGIKNLVQVLTTKFSRDALNNRSILYQGHIRRRNVFGFLGKSSTGKVRSLNEAQEGDRARKKEDPYSTYDTEKFQLGDKESKFGVRSENRTSDFSGKLAAARSKVQLHKGESESNKKEKEKEKEKEDQAVSGTSAQESQQSVTRTTHLHDKKSKENEYHHQDKKRKQENEIEKEKGKGKGKEGIATSGTSAQQSQQSVAHTRQSPDKKPQENEYQQQEKKIKKENEKQHEKGREKERRQDKEDQVVSVTSQQSVPRTYDKKSKIHEHDTEQNNFDSKTKLHNEKSKDLRGILASKPSGSSVQSIPRVSIAATGRKSRISIMSRPSVSSKKTKDKHNKQRMSTMSIPGEGRWKDSIRESFRTIKLLADREFRAKLAAAFAAADKYLEKSLIAEPTNSDESFFSNEQATDAAIKRRRSDAEKERKRDQGSKDSKQFFDFFASAIEYNGGFIPPWDIEVPWSEVQIRLDFMKRSYIKTLPNPNFAYRRGMDYYLDLMKEKFQNPS